MIMIIVILAVAAVVAFIGGYAVSALINRSHS